MLSGADKLSAGDFVLTVGATSDEVTVTADAGQVQLQSSSGERSDLIKQQTTERRRHERTQRAGLHEADSRRGRYP